MKQFRRCSSRRLAVPYQSQAIIRLLTAVVCCLSLAAGSGAPRAAAVGYAITDLGSLGGPRTIVQGMNNLGQVVGMSDTGPDSGATEHGFLYGASGMHDLYTLLSGTIWFGNGINDAGQIVGAGWFGGGPGAPEHAFLYDGSLHDLTPAAPGRSRAVAVNAKGHVAGFEGAYGGSDSPLLGFFYDGTSLHNLGTLPGYYHSIPVGINASDQIIGDVGTDGLTKQHAYLWTNGVMQDLGTLGGRYSFARGINDAGQVVGSSTLPGRVDDVNDGPQHAFLYDSSGMHDLGTLGGDASYGGGINNLGQVVGTSVTTAGDYAPQHLFLYSNGTMQDLSLRFLFSPPSDAFRPWAINDRGQILIAAQIGPNERGYLLTPVPAPQISLNPDHLDFGNQPVGATSAPQSVTLTNTGDAPLAINGLTFTGTNPFRFAISSDSGEATLAPGASRTVQITFTPSKAADFSAALAVSDNDQFISSNHYVKLSGTGALPDAVVNVGNSLDCGSQKVGTTSDAKTVLIGNGSVAPLVIRSVSVEGPDAAEFSATDLAGTTVRLNEEHPLSVRFTPAARGPRSATLVITDNAPDSPQRVTLNGTGTAPVVRVNPKALDFGKEPVGLSGSLALLLQNTGDAPLAVSSLTFQGANAGDFTLATDGVSGQTLQPGDIVLLNIRFSPAATGSRSASLVIPDDADGSPQLVPLTGFGTEPLLTLSANSLLFTVQPGSTAASTQTLVITNGGDAPLTVDGFTLAGADPGSFQIVSDTGQKSLDPGASRTLQISFSPASTASVAATRSAGTRPRHAHIASASYSAILQIQHNDPHPGSPHTVTLTAVVSAPDPNAPPAAPTGLTATIVPSLGGAPAQVMLSWTDNSSNEKALAVWRKSGTGDWQRIGVVVPHTTTFVDPTVGPATRYTYRVRATTDTQASAWSNEASASLPPAPTAPSGLSVQAASFSEIDLTWTSGDSSNGRAFAIWRKEGSGDWHRVGVIAPNTTSFADRGLAPGTLYTYRVRATNDHFPSDWTNEATATTLAAPPAAPTSLTATAASAGEIDLAWTSGGGNETGVAIFRKAGSGDWQRIAVVSPKVTRYVDRSVQAGVSYLYRVRTHNDHFASAWSNEVTASTPAAP